MDAVAAFADAIRSAGIDPPDNIEADGTLHRFATNGKRGDLAGFYVLFGDGIPAGRFGCWRAGIDQTWHAAPDRPMTDSEQRAHRERVENMRRARDAEQLRRQREAAEQAARTWQDAAPATADHAYLAGKGIAPHGARVHNGRVVIPLLDAAGKLHSLQYIDVNGKKLFMSGGRVKGCFHVIGDPGNTDKLVMAEGFATAASVHEATGLPAVAAFSASNLLPVARAIRERYPHARLVIIADNDAQTDGNPGVTAARAAAESVRGLLAIPEAIDGRATDANDLHRAQGINAVRRLVENAEPAVSDAWYPPEPIEQREWSTARLTPDCIIENLVFADVALRIGSGGMGKTTLELFEAIHITLGLPLYGLQVHRPGPVAFFTAEDSREMMVARLRKICEAMLLTPTQIERVQARVLISDLSGMGLRLTEVLGDVVRPSAFVDTIAAGLRDLEPSLLVIDPAVSFGVGESRVNDAEQGLIEAARRLRRALNCCVRYVHHTGKGNARERTLDQYTGRGGSAFADGARMVHVLQPLAPADWLKATGTELAPGENGLILARPKMSYCPPQTDIYLRRRGYLFEHVEATENGPAATVTRNADTIWSTLEAEYLAGRLHTQNSLQSLGTGLTRPEVRDTVHWLEAAGRIERRARPGTVARGAREYLHPVAAPDSDGAPNPKTPDSPDRCADEKSGLAGAPPLGKEETAHREAPFSSPVSLATPEQPGAPRAQRAHRGNRDWEGEL